MKQRRLQYGKLRLLLVLIVLCAGTGCAKRPGLQVTGVLEETVSEPEGLTEEGMGAAAFAQAEEPQTEPPVTVYVCGAVQSPGVYALPQGARLYEAVAAAGGFAGDADQEWLNQAELLQDGGKVRIYTRQEVQKMQQDGGIPEPGAAAFDGAAGGPGTASQDGRINLNTATREELMTLPGIGEAKADAVIRYREEQGKFLAIEEIMQISGIKDAVFAQIKDKIIV